MHGLLKLLPEPGKDQVAEEAIRALVAGGVDRSTILYDPDGFQLRVNGSGVVPLGDLRARCRTVWPWKRATVARQFVSLHLDRPERPATIEGARHRLLPGLCDSFALDALRLRAEAEGQVASRPGGRPLGSRLWVACFLDHPGSAGLVVDSDLAAWGVSAERCLEMAIENLAARSPGALDQVARGVYHSTWRDGYDPARMLLGDRLAPLDLRGEPVAFAPNGNHLIVTGAEDVEGLALSLLFAMNVLAEEPGPMSAIPLVRRGEGWVDLEVPRGHALEPLLRRARVSELHHVYAEQARLLEKVHERSGSDVYVAKYNGLCGEKNDDYDDYTSHSLWAKGVVTLLPRSERVLFFDDERPRTERILADVDWSVVRQHCSALMQDGGGHCPPRYLVREFPSEERLEAMRAAQARGVGPGKAA
jgi:hypothetical protein